MNIVGDFQKVSLNQFIKDSILLGCVADDASLEVVKGIWEKIYLPTRATVGSAGYDFYTPWSFALRRNESITIPTGIRANIKDGWFLMILPRSGLGFKYGVKMVNTAGIIDSDYFHAENEGHILCKITCEENICLRYGERFVQGIFVPYGVASSDGVTAVRTGGIGSTGT